MSGTSEFAARSIAKGSKSFAAASKLFDARTRDSVVKLYAWCRHCDDVVDGQEAGSAERQAGPASPRARIEGLRRDTARAFDGETDGLDPSFVALADVVRRHKLPRADADAHLAGFEMDVDGRSYETLDDLLLYAFRVAGVVGVMMARIMGVRDEDVLDRASDLGLAFQLTNIARDVVDDAKAGRVYLPLEWLREEGLTGPGLADPANKAAVARLRRRLVAEAEPYYASARIGIDALPPRAAWAVGAAHGIYRAIGVNLVAKGQGAFAARVSTSKPEKLLHLVRGWRMAVFRGGGTIPRDPALWTRSRED